MIYDLDCPYHYEGRYDPEEKQFKVIAEFIDKISVLLFLLADVAYNLI